MRFLQVITDNARNCVKAGKILMERYPNITWTGCTAHGLDLLLEDIGKLPWVKDVVTKGKELVKFFTLHHLPLALFRKYSKKELLKPAATRFCYAHVMLQRLVETKAAIKKASVCSAFKKWSKKPSNRPKADAAMDIISEASFWKDCERVLVIFQPIVKLLRLCDGNLPVVGKIYWGFYKIQEAVKEMKMPSRDRKVLEKMVKDR